MVKPRRQDVAFAAEDEARHGGSDAPVGHNTKKQREHNQHQTPLVAQTPHTQNKSDNNKDRRQMIATTTYNDISVASDG